MATPKPGLALGGGGRRGLAHIGVLRALCQAELPVAAIAGTSIGGLVGAAFAAGVSPEQLEMEIGALRSLSGILRLVAGQTRALLGAQRDALFRRTHRRQAHI